MINQNHSQEVKPMPGVQRMTYMSVVNGRKMTPRIGHSQLPLKGAEHVRTSYPDEQCP
jgi:hypothetical protein